MKADSKIKANAYFEKGCAARDAGRYARARQWLIRSAAGLPDRKQKGLRKGDKKRDSG